MEDFKKVINPCKVLCGKYYRNAFCRVEYTEGRLSITGVVGPLESGNCYGSWGQIVDVLNQPGRKLVGEWSRVMIEEFTYIWKAYHLNDMQPACEHQRARGQTWKTHPEAFCRYCNHSLGSKWLYMAVPEAELEFLKELPGTTKTPAWV